MSKLVFPLSKLLRPPGAVPDRMWMDFEARRRETGVLARMEPRGPTYRWWTAAALAGAAVAALVVRWAGQGHPGEVGPLRLVDGSEPIGLEVAAGAPGERSWTLTDGSRLSLLPRARLEILENTNRSVVVIVRDGRVSFEVKPGGPRHWTIECGVVTVDVVGTAFEVERRVQSVRVDVQRGAVLVRGEGIADRVRRLAAGESLEVGSDLPGAVVEPQGTIGSAAAAPGAPAGVSSVAPREATRRPLPDPARRAAHQEAYRALGARETPSTTVANLLAVADMARLSGHPGEAVGPLARVVAEHPQDSRAALAAFTLGQIRLDALAQPARAAEAFAAAIALGVPEALLEDAFVRLVEARAKAGDRGGAHSAAEEYARRVPGGGGAEILRRWLNLK